MSVLNEMKGLLKGHGVPLSRCVDSLSWYLNNVDMWTTPLYSSQRVCPLPLLFGLGAAYRGQWCAECGGISIKGTKRMVKNGKEIPTYDKTVRYISLPT